MLSNGGEGVIAVETDEFKSGFECRERESQFNTAGGSECQVRGTAVLNNRLMGRVLSLLKVARQ